MTTPLLYVLLAADLAPQLNQAEPVADYIVLDARSRQVIAERWADADTPIPMGSLVKPFLSLSWTGKYPAFECRGAAGACWRPQPHGHLDFAEALAQSCNAYFLQLAAGVDERSLQSTAATFGIAAPKAQTPEARIGLGDAWKISPHALLKAYAELAAHRGDPRIDPILTGLALSARHGTSKELGVGALAKTGTAECPAPRRHAGDGLAIVLAPADAPRYAVLVRQHDVPGSSAAAAARRILQALRP